LRSCRLHAAAIAINRSFADSTFEGGRGGLLEPDGREANDFIYPRRDADPSGVQSGQDIAADAVFEPANVARGAEELITGRIVYGDLQHFN
jgi:hypothetical protein